MPGASRPSVSDLFLSSFPAPLFSVSFCNFFIFLSLPLFLSLFPKRKRKDERLGGRERGNEVARERERKRESVKERRLSL